MNKVLFLHKHREISVPILAWLMVLHLKIEFLFIPRTWYPAWCQKASMSVFINLSNRLDKMRFFAEKVLDPNYKPIFTVINLEGVPMGQPNVDDTLEGGYSGFACLLFGALLVVALVGGVIWWICN